MSRFANLADKPKPSPKPRSQPAAPGNEEHAGATVSISTLPRSNSRAGRKAIAGYFSLEMSLAMHVCARKHGLSLQELMAEAFDDVLRKYGQSPVGE
ncbi:MULTISPECIES: ribbon-helix-helix domain-containing protein [unclassified Novosphingobium]|uniref:ribbon-helix-helix domain-containing protein n=1 Tax=unclassified Novosphingobium TaxID=2644732 RepID=UPI00086D18FF|nr:MULTISPECIES: ribbon-helix-helix domain-containing protein [unclassified Novosphingobium]MBN9146008.1 hypothetical protein [Novosphingobium sp.]ODU79397.1 MAG: hypothetical protein ABT10_20705 [Novosphingobium sp. SCN 63-17]OJX94108.1 MAG: hypothetical protein BGP00_05305 [Novosphingobium sp. 63-713]